MVFGQQAAAGGAPSADVRELQDEITNMQTELDAMKWAMQVRSIGSDPSQMMGQQMRGMMSRCGMGMMRGMRSVDAAAPPQPEQDVLLDLPGDHTLGHLSEKTKAAIEMAGGKSFGRVCSQCHTLPSPKLHTARDWPRVVERMRENMFRMFKPVPDRATTEAIVAFLSANAS
ncbi:MAG TPA: hypothetical protein VKT99_04820 [Xanthobacteraceae bacterium]|nr:hypothetical protein [Xanthobacteraceae bacterium]